MNKFYVIVPVVLLGVFLVFYRGAVHKMEEKEKAKAAEVAMEKKKEDDRRKELDQKAQEDARKRTEERERIEREKAAKKEKDYVDFMKQLKDDTDRYTAEGDQAQKEANALELQLAELRTQKERLNTEAFNLAKQVEAGKIDRRTAELEIQRMVEMVAQRVGASSFANIPPPPPTPSK